MNSSYIDAIRTFEGFTSQARLDYAQFTNGYGTRARHAGEVIDRAEAERRFQAEIANARATVERFAPNADEGTKAALTSLTYNAGPGWARDGLGDAVRRGDLEEVRAIFCQYCKAGGDVVPGLVSRRSAEALWIGSQPGELNGPSLPPPPGMAALSASTAEIGDGAARRETAMGAARLPSATIVRQRQPVGDRLATAAGGDGSPTASVTASANTLISSNLTEMVRLVKLESGRHLRVSESRREDARAREPDQTS